MRLRHALFAIAACALLPGCAVQTYPYGSSHAAGCAVRGTGTVGGAALGGVGGAFLGRSLGGRKGRGTRTVVGGLAGAALGGVLGNGLDNATPPCGTAYPAFPSYPGYDPAGYPDRPDLVPAPPGAYGYGPYPAY